MKILVNLFLKIVIILSGFSLFLKLILGREESFGFIYFSAIISFYLLLFCFFAMLTKICINKFKKEVFLEFKTEIILFSGAVGVIILLGLTN